MKRNLEKQLRDEQRMGISKFIPHGVDQFLFHYRNTLCAATRKTPDELFFSWTPRTWLTLLHPEFHNHLENHERRPAQLPAACCREFREGDRVQVKATRPCDPAWVVGVIIRRIKTVTYVVTVENQERFVHADHLVETTFPVTEEPQIRHPVSLPRTLRPHSSENARPVDTTTLKGPTSPESASPPSVEDRTPEPPTPRPTNPACDASKTTPYQRPDHGERGAAVTEPPRPVPLRRSLRERR
ncbi:hypothetical protein MTO96_035638 [Rhipicephalus appendiculatus]